MQMNPDDIAEVDLIEYLHKAKLAPKKVIEKLKTMACRKAVKVGDTLSKKDQEAIVRNLSEMDDPWSCPHGRPTLRYLFKA